jgi:hypothetical protein
MPKRGRNKRIVGDRPSRRGVAWRRGRGFVAVGVTRTFTTFVMTVVITLGGRVDWWWLWQRVLRTKAVKKAVKRAPRRDSRVVNILVGGGVGVIYLLVSWRNLVDWRWMWEDDYGI